MRRGRYLLPLCILLFAFILTGPAATIVRAQDTHGNTAVESDTAGHGDVEAAAGHGDTAGGHGAEAGGHAASSVTPEKIDNLIWRTLNFVVLVVILFLVLRKPIGAFFSGRREEIARTLEEFEKKKNEVEARYKELEGKLSDLTAEREKIMAEFVKEGQDEKAKIIANAEVMAERVKVQAEKTIDLEIKSAKAELVAEIAGMSANMAEELVKKNINESDQKRLVEEYLKKVVQN